MKEALKAAINNGFSHMELNRIHAYVALKNTASGKLLESLGFLKRGIYRTTICSWNSIMINILTPC
ncbi:GNAT family N-acetyltransferase [Bacillus infantis]|uniref:GNAT family N-acetyltransferase n=1 Tax=Bacillus infantis TaxID=324767 RepID=UPI0021E539D1|nr:GNAT family N-acetyltransferase [Bacillus infantis]